MNEDLLPQLLIILKKKNGKKFESIFTNKSQYFEFIQLVILITQNYFEVTYSKYHKLMLNNVSIDDQLSRLKKEREITINKLKDSGALKEITKNYIVYKKRSLIISGDSPTKPLPKSLKISLSILNKEKGSDDLQNYLVNYLKSNFINSSYTDDNDLFPYLID